MWRRTGRADWLHREATWLLDHWAEKAGGKGYEQADAETQAVLRERLKKEIRSNTYDPATGDLVVSPLRAEAIKAVGAHYAALFGDDPELRRAAQGLCHPRGHHQDAGAAAADERFFFWAAWACGTDRPGSAITYTKNWPPEALIGNRPTGSDCRLVGGQLRACCWRASALWSGISPSSAARGEQEPADVPERDPLLALNADALHAGHAEVLLGRGRR